MICNDAELVVRGLVAMLRHSEDRVEVVSATIGEIPDISADVALVDAFGQPDAGLARVRSAVARPGIQRVALYTWKVSPTQIRQVLDIGGDAVLSKAHSASDLVDRVERVHLGERVVDDVSTELTQPSSDPDLTGRDVELLTLVAHGLSNAEIAEKTFLATSSVKTYLKFLYAKLGISSRTQAVLRAVELGLVDVPRGDRSAPMR